MSAGFRVNYSVEIVGDGSTTVFVLTATRRTTLSNPNVDIQGGLDIGVPVSVEQTGVPGAVVTLNGLTITITFSTAPSGVVFGTIGVNYG